VLTWCCGGPAETLHPELAADRARERVAELREVASSGITMCPICLVNLQKAAGDSMRFTDISHYLRSAYGA
jgi:Fe-S oxidoreductase